MVSNSISCMVLCPAAAACWAATHGQMTMSPSTPSITVFAVAGAQLVHREAHHVGRAFEVHPTHVQLGDGIRVHEHDGQVGLGAHAHLVEYPNTQIGEDLGVDDPLGFIGDVNAHRLSRFGWLNPLAGGHRSRYGCGGPCVRCRGGRRRWRSDGRRRPRSGRPAGDVPRPRF